MRSELKRHGQNFTRSTLGVQRLGAAFPRRNTDDTAFGQRMLLQVERVVPNALAQKCGSAAGYLRIRGYFPSSSGEAGPPKENRSALGLRAREERCWNFSR